MVTGRHILRVLGWTIGLALIGFAFFWILFAVEAGRAWREGEKELAAGNDVAAQANFERAIRSRCPLNFSGWWAAERLEAMAEGYEKAGNIPRAISAYESLMTSLSAIDTGWSPSRHAKLKELERKILALQQQAREKGTAGKESK